MDSVSCLFMFPFLRTCEATCFLSHVYIFPRVGFCSISVPRSLLCRHGCSLWKSSCGTILCWFKHYKSWGPFYANFNSTGLNNSISYSSKIWNLRWREWRCIEQLSVLWACFLLKLQHMIQKMEAKLNWKYLCSFFLVKKMLTYGKQKRLVVCICRVGVYVHMNTHYSLSH